MQENPKKRKPTTRDTSEGFYARGRAFYQETEKAFKDTRENHFASLKVIKEQLDTRLNEHQVQLEKMQKVFESIEDTLLNVLLAIRQNNFLQAHYPDQLGFPEMKVTGSHPAKLSPLKPIHLN